MDKDTKPRKTRVPRSAPGVVAQARVHLWGDLVGMITEFQNGRIGFAYPALEQAYRRMLFNIVGRNQDDHVKNISFLMRDSSSGWELAPAYDLTFAAGSNYTRMHQMTAAGKADDFTGAELVEIGRKFGIRNPAVILDEMIEVFMEWPNIAKKFGVAPDDVLRVKAMHRINLSM